LVLAALQQGEADEAALVKLLKHRDWRVRQAAAEVLGRLERVGPETVGALIQALIDSDFDVRKAAQQTLTEFARRDELLTPALLVGLNSINTKVRIRMAEVAGQLGDQCPKEIREVLRTMLGERRSDLKRAAAKALLELDLVGDEVTNVFVTELCEDDVSVHEEAYQSLLRIAGPECGLMVQQR
jgi:HEAT repeat protein